MTSDYDTDTESTTADESYLEEREEEDFDEHGLNPSGYDRDGYNAKGFDKLGYNKDGFDIDGLNENGETRSEVEARIIAGMDMDEDDQFQIDLFGDVEDSVGGEEDDAGTMLQPEDMEEGNNAPKATLRTKPGLKDFQLYTSPMLRKDVLREIHQHTSRLEAIAKKHDVPIETVIQQAGWYTVTYPPGNLRGTKRADSAWSVFMRDECYQNYLPRPSREDFQQNAVKASRVFRGLSKEKMEELQQRADQLNAEPESHAKIRKAEKKKFMCR